MRAIEMYNVSKRFLLHHSRPRSFQELMLSAFKRGDEYRRGEEFWALRDVSFKVDEGEAVAIIGSNGSGKSTCLKLLTQIIEPTQGRVQVNGRVSALLELGTGFHPELTGRENVFLNASLLGMKRRDIKPRLDEIVGFAELERFIDIPVKFYSSGMYVRLAFAVAINVDPDVLVIDEVLAVGDQSFQTRCLERIHALRARGVTILFVSHSMDAVRSFCTRAIWLDNGILREEGPTDVVTAHYVEHVERTEEPEADQVENAEFAVDAVAVEVEEPSIDARASLPEEEPGDVESDAEPDAAEESGDPLQERRRWGSREVEITEVSFLDDKGVSRDLQYTGEPLTIAVHYRAHRRVKNPVFGLGIYNNTGEHLWGTNTFLMRYPVTEVEGTGEMRYIIDSLPLAEGSYYLSASVHDVTDTPTYDFHHLCFEFQVKHRVPEPRCAVYIPARWELLSETEQVKGGTR